MQSHELKKINGVKSRKRVGRGGKRGTYSGHGGKGQTARAGHNLRPIVRDILKRYPKLRGYKNRPIGKPCACIDLARINAKYEPGEVVAPESLVRKGLTSRVSGKIPQVKILGSGDATKPLSVSGCSLSKTASEKIVKAGGSVK